MNSYSRCAVPAAVVYLPISYLVPAFTPLRQHLCMWAADAEQCQQAGDFNDAIDALSGLVCGVFIVLTANIVTGIMPGFVCLVCGRVIAGEWRQVNPGIMLLTAALVPFYAAMLFT